MKWYIPLLTTLLLIFNLCAATADRLKILVPEDAIPAEATAAKELQAGLKKIFGVELPVVKGEAPAPTIRVGQSPETARLLGGIDFKTLKPDEIILKSVGGNLILTGDRPRGSLYAVYELLEREYGVRFWTAKAESWPIRKEFTLPQIDYRYAPAFKSREAFYDLIQQSPAFAAKMRSNGHFDRIPEELGGHLELLGWCHSFEQFIPPGKFFADHPEWFAEVNGKRVKDGQLCLTNPDVRKQLTAGALAALRKKPETRIISVSQNDNKQFCCCKSCEAFVKTHGNQSDLLIDAVNEVAGAVAKEFPNVKVETLAYQYTRQTPKTVRPLPNVIVRLCSIECDFSTPLDSPVNAAFASEVRDWGKLAEELYIWNYVTNFSKYYLPHPNWKSLAPDLRFFAANGATAIFEQGSSGPGSIADFADLRAWLTAKLLWNPSQDSEKLTQEFVNGYYGPAAPEVLRYLALMDGSIKPGSRLGCYNNSTFWLDDRQLLEAWSLMEAAKAKAKADPEMLQRVESAAVSINLALLERDSIWASQPELLRGIKWNELLDRQLEIAKSAETKKFSESSTNGSYDMLKKRIALRHALGGGDAPEIAAGRQWKGIRAADANRYGAEKWIFIEDDSAATGGKALRMPNTHQQWASQCKDLPNGEYDVYAEIRCDSNQPTGNAAVVGIYNDKERKSIAKTEIPAESVAGKKYRTVKLGTIQLSPSIILYCNPVINPAVENIWIDRYILVEKK